MSVDRSQMEAYAELGIGVRSIEMGEHPAVLVVDLQRVFVEGELASSLTEGVLERTASLLAAARDAALPVYYVRVVYDDLGQVGIAFSTKCPSTLTCLRGAPETEIHPAVAPKPGDRVIDKHRASAFFGTPLEDELRAAGIDTLFIVGTSTSGCVRASAVDASSLDFRVIVVDGCVDDRAPKSHESALTDLHAKYAEVMTLDDVLSLLAERQGSPA